MGDSPRPNGDSPRRGPGPVFGEGSREAGREPPSSRSRRGAVRESRIFVAGPRCMKICCCCCIGAASCNASAAAAAAAARLRSSPNSEPSPAPSAPDPQAVGTSPGAEDCRESPKDGGWAPPVPLAPPGAAIVRGARPCCCGDASPASLTPLLAPFVFFKMQVRMGCPCWFLLLFTLCRSAPAGFSNLVASSELPSNQTSLWGLGRFDAVDWNSARGPI
mmetsp:Transcript_52407/g.118442  ORF Transcript_52407/g.118442 Transcript_52407/m.118442 type:complete len:219 (-) Transcript_52407:645-1301(-)